jgi:hypothetical protein
MLSEDNLMSPKNLHYKSFARRKAFYSKACTTILLIILSIVSQNFFTHAAVVQLKVQAVDVRDAPLAGAKVTLFAPPPGAYLVAEASTDSKGVATFTLTDPPDYVNVFISWKDVVVSQSKISSQSGFSKIICNVGLIKVRVMSLTNKIVSGFKVSITWGTYAGPKSIYNFTDKDGFAVFASMPLQSYNLEIYWFDTSYKVYSETFTPKPDTVYEVKAPLYEFLVEVRDTSGRPVSNAEVVLGNSLKTFRSYTVNGISSFGNLFAGTYSLKVSYAGTVYKSMDVNIDSDKQISIIVPAVKTYTLTVQVVDEYGKPLTNSKVIIVDAENKVRGELLTDSSGSVKFTLQEGIYTIHVAYGTQTSKQDVQLSSDKFQKIVVYTTSNTLTQTTTPYFTGLDPTPIIIILASILIAITIFFIIVKRISQT